MNINNTLRSFQNPRWLRGVAPAVVPARGEFRRLGARRWRWSPWRQPGSGTAQPILHPSGARERSIRESYPVAPSGRTDRCGVWRLAALYSPHADVLALVCPDLAGNAGYVLYLRGPGSGRSPDRGGPLRLFPCLRGPGALVAEALLSAGGAQA